MRYHTEFSLEAKQDLSNIYKYIKYTLQEPKIAKELISQIRTKINSLENNPKLYPIIDDDYIKKLEIRKIIVKNYIIFYRVIEPIKLIQIERIM